MKNFEYKETMVWSQFRIFYFILYLMKIQQITTHSQWSQSWFSLWNACYYSVQKQHTFHRMCRNTVITPHKSVFLLFCLFMKISLEEIWEQSAGENIWVCTDVTWAKTTHSCLWLCYRLDNPGLSFQQSQKVFLCHKMS